VDDLDDLGDRGDLESDPDPTVYLRGDFAFRGEATVFVDLDASWFLSGSFVGDSFSFVLFLLSVC